MDIKEQLLSTPTAQQWNHIGIKPHHGLALPLFSLHSKNSLGIGEYLDLIPLVDWSQSIGLDVIQLLPLNDPGLDASPYNSISAFALNPIHISLGQLPFLSEFPELMEKFKNLPSLPRTNKVDYKTVRATKEEFLRAYFRTVFPKISSNEDYKKFISQSASWLKGYTLFKTLKSLHNWTAWESWPQELHSLSSELLEKLFLEHQDEIEWHSFLQYLCDLQLKQAFLYATQKNIFLMGDIPILIGRDSADVWLNRDIFNLNFSAGAPPDMFAAEGQKWGFPVFNWESIASNGYRWWIDRLKLAANYYHIFRIDHVVGFFRIWAIPSDKEGKDGFFIPEDRNTWIDHGEKIMKVMLEASPMFPIAEDLGDVLPSIRVCLNHLGIPGTKVIRWERNWEQDRSFIPFNLYPPISMTTLSTHDSETLEQWWTNNRSDSEEFSKFKGWDYRPVLSLEHRLELLKDSHRSNSLFHINLLGEYLALFPELVWSNPEDERINIPGLYSERNWTYRLRPSIEELAENQLFSNLLKEIIS